ncbi:hypothetical protein [Polaromonas sp. SM01]|uniref:hypothetical protein n=1 Tax=Polaromonas sp. SM01 TaxID=3085630 RepID=UPI00298226E7|nr:hypothetical protein [Polaromonas sp. SM01]MDW5443819.1 hypothetical protein [Polaromonas sp. SM01]
MSERGDQVQRLLGALSKHADLVAEAFEGSVSGGEKQRNAGIEALFGLSVLKPYDEDSYRLNPRLREFMADYFSSYQAFQALRRVSGTMQQAREQWRELRRLKLVGATRDVGRLHAALDESIVEMAYSIEHNLTLLHSLISTQYGNVDDLSSKLRQNRYYAQQVKLFLQDVEAIDVFVDLVADEAIAAGLPQVRQLVIRRLAARRLQWTSQIKDAQAVISKRLFEAKLMEVRLKRLSRFALWLARNKTSDGWELAVDEKTDVALFRPDGLELRPQPDATDMEPATREGLLAAVAKMPNKPTVSTAETNPGPQLLLEDDTEVQEVVDPQQVALRELAIHAASATGPLSLLSWKHHRTELTDVTDEAWLMFACLQLKGSGFQVEFLQNVDLDPFPINEQFHDIEVRCALTLVV